MRHFGYRLAHELNHADVDALLESLDYHKVLEWVAYFALENKRDKKEFSPSEFEQIAANHYGQSR